MNIRNSSKVTINIPHVIEMMRISLGKKIFVTNGVFLTIPDSPKDVPQVKKFHNKIPNKR